MDQRIPLCLSLSIAFGTVSAQTPVIQWQRAMGGTTTDIAYAAQQTADGGYIVAGNTDSNDGDVTGNHGGDDAWLVKLDGTGAISWQRAAGGTSTDKFYAVQQTPDGGYIAAGYTGSSNGDVAMNHGDLDAWVVKFDALGAIVWEHTYGGVSTEVAYAITTTADGGYVFAGTSRSFALPGNHGLEDFWVVKLSGSGGELWQQQYGGSSDEQPYSVVQLVDGDYLVSGMTASSDGDVTGQHGAQDAWVVKVGSSGTLLWQSCLGGTGYDYAYKARQTADGGSIMAASATSNDGDVSGNHSVYNDAWIVKLDATGGITWQKMLGGSSSDRAKDIQQTADGGYVFIGDADSQDGDLSGNIGIADIWLVKTDALGSIEWQRTLGGSLGETGYAFDVTADGGYFIAGVTNSDDGDVSGMHGLGDAWAVKLSGAGTGIDELHGPVISIGANPCAGPLTISAAQDQGALNISLIDAVGRQVLQERMTGTTHILDLSDRPSGVYLLSVRSANGVHTVRVVLE